MWSGRGLRMRRRRGGAWWGDGGGGGGERGTHTALPPPGFPPCLPLLRPPLPLPLPRLLLTCHRPKPSPHRLEKSPFHERCQRHLRRVRSPPPPPKPHPLLLSGRRWRGQQRTILALGWTHKTGIGPNNPPSTRINRPPHPHPWGGVVVVRRGRRRSRRNADHWRGVAPLPLPLPPPPPWSSSRMSA